MIIQGEDLPAGRSFLYLFLFPDVSYIIII